MRNSISYAHRAFPPQCSDRVSKAETCVETLDLEGGSALVMLPGMQERYKHSLPARRKGLIGPRLNVTLRQHQGGQGMVKS
jgi:hypothetical protein